MSGGKATPIKRIYAKASAYKDGALVKQATDNQYNASYAGAAEKLEITVGALKDMVIIFLKNKDI